MRGGVIFGRALCVCVRAINNTTTATTTTQNKHLREREHEAAEDRDSGDAVRVAACAAKLGRRHEAHVRGRDAARDVGDEEVGLEVVAHDADDGDAADQLLVCLFVDVFVCFWGRWVRGERAFGGRAARSTPLCRPLSAQRQTANGSAAAAAAATG
jgi:hypothetical protein